MFTTVLPQTLGKKSSMKPQRNGPRALNINYLGNDTSYKSSVSNATKWTSYHFTCIENDPQLTECYANHAAHMKWLVTENKG